MIEFFFDCSSPWTYLAFHNIQPIAKEFGVEISWRPILVGGIFNSEVPEFKKLGCKDDGERAYRCYIEVITKRGKKIIPARFVKGSDGWVVTN